MTETDYSQILRNNVRPEEYQNPAPLPRYDLVVIGGGTAGLVSATGAAALGARVALVETRFLGGDCLIFGCVPSKSLLRCARQARDLRNSDAYGVRCTGEIRVDFAEVMNRLRRVQSEISYHDSLRRFSDLGIHVFLGQGAFRDPHSLQVGEHTLRFSRAIIATGSRAMVPSVDGLADAGYQTNETIFSLQALPARLAVIGGGPLGCELAQAFQAFGSHVTIIERSARIMPRDEPEASELMTAVFRREGIDIRLETGVLKVTKNAGDKILHLLKGKETESIAADEILLGAGRVPNVEGMNLEAAGVKYDHARGVLVDDFLRTSQGHIFAAGDICLAAKFTHTADASARIAVENALIWARKKTSNMIVPWCTYTEPEVAHVGLTEKEAARDNNGIEAIMVPLGEVDRAVLDGETEGFLKVILRKGSDKILGATIVASHAGEMISGMTLAMSAGIGLGRLDSVIHPYPTQAEIYRRAASVINRRKLTPLVQNLLKRYIGFRNR